MFELLPCLKCGEANSSRLRFFDNVIECPECEGETTLDEIKIIVNDWAAVLDWLRKAPKTPSEISAET